MQVFVAGIPPEFFDELRPPLLEAIRAALEEANVPDQCELRFTLHPVAPSLRAASERGWLYIHPVGVDTLLIKPLIYAVANLCLKHGAAHGWWYTGFEPSYLFLHGYSCD